MARSKLSVTFEGAAYNIKSMITLWEWLHMETLLREPSEYAEELHGLLDLWVDMCKSAAGGPWIKRSTLEFGLSLRDAFVSDKRTYLDVDDGS